jgi:hypothetical protein
MEHEWSTIIESTNGKLETCTKCGLLRIKTISATYHAVYWSKPFLNCTGYTPHLPATTPYQ